MAHPRYGNGIGWCKRGQHYVGDVGTRLAINGQKYCLEHHYQVRVKPRAKKWKAKYYDRLKTKVAAYSNT